MTGENDYGEPAWKSAIRTRLDSVDRSITGGSHGYHRDSPACLEISLPFPDWDKRKYVALDVETTGLDPRRDRIVELAMIAFSIDSEAAVISEGTFHSLFDPGIPMPQRASEINGLKDSDLKGESVFKEKITGIANFLHGRCIIAHNSGFDLAFLRHEFLRCSLKMPESVSIDTLPLSRNAFPGHGSYALTAIARTLNISTGHSHRALDDTRTCMMVFLQCMRKISNACQ